MPSMVGYFFATIATGLLEERVPVGIPIVLRPLVSTEICNKSANQSGSSLSACTDDPFTPDVYPTRPGRRVNGVGGGV